MLTVEEAQQRILAQVTAQPVESVRLAEAYGRVLAEGVTSRVAVPPWNNSAMDGYAVRAADTAEGEVTLRLLEMVGAGAVASVPVEPGTAIGVMTGAPVPPGADAVVMVERTDGAQQGTVTIQGRVSVGDHIREKGEDVREGDEVLEAGDVLTPARVGLASSLGHTELPVRRRPVVAVLTTGDEVVAPGTPLKPGQIWGSNGASLCGLVHLAGGTPLDLGNAPDEPEATRRGLQRAVEEADVVVTTGGVSVGAYDFVRDAIGAVGGELDFWKVRMKPGKPLAFGMAGPVPLFGLPGNPVSCMVNFLQFVRPWIRASLGDPRPFLPVVQGVAGEDFRERPGRARLIRVTLRRDADTWRAFRTGSQSSGVLTSMAKAHGLLLVGIDDPPPRAGEPVRVQLFDTLPGGAGPDYGW
ncbi:MAG: molybdopterin molybdotransferase MoeA [Myxococcales bacterium]|nr:molybdopterin molybdotransferase MoeA [Myxococcales bacterium]